MKTIIGAFDSFGEARNAVDALERSGFNERDVSIVANNASTSGSTSADTGQNDRPSIGGETMTGAVVGGLAGLVVGLAPFVIPGLGAIAAAGWLTMTLTGAAIGAGVGLVGALMGVGVPEEEAHYYNESIRRGGTLVLVRAEDNLADDAAHILSQYGAIDIDERAAQYRNEGFVPGATMNMTGSDVTASTSNAAGYNTAGYNPSATTPLMATTNATRDVNPMNAMDTIETMDTRDRTPVNNRTGDDTTIPVIEEQVQVGKQQVQRGGVRVYRHVTETPVTEQVNLREEHVHVDRRPVNRPVSGIEDTDLREGVIEVRETAEIPVVRKDARVVEEVMINKDVTERMENVQDTVRRTDVEVEEIPGSVGASRTTGTMEASGVVDTRGPLEKAEDFVTGDNIDDKTGQPVTSDTRNAAQKAGEALTGTRR